MSEVFQLDHRRLAADPGGAGLLEILAIFPQIDSNESFNRYCQAACRAWERKSCSQTTQFHGLLRQITAGGPDVIQTAWGGVLVTFHRPPKVEKFLVIRAGSYLALEKHEWKDEHLEVREGAGLIVRREASDQPLTVESIKPGDLFHLAPGMEHCLIGTENLLVFEHSTDPKGMDQDLIFIYEPAIVKTLL